MTVKALFAHFQVSDIFGTVINQTCRSAWSVLYAKMSDLFLAFWFKQIVVINYAFGIKLSNGQ